MPKKKSLAIFYLTVLSVLLGLLPNALAQQNLVEGARKEGKLILYTAMNLSDTVAITQAFTQKYPFIDVEYYRSSTQKLLPRLTLEASTNRNMADVITGSFPLWDELKQKGLLMRYQSSESQTYPADMKDPEGHWAIFFLQVMGITYNTKLVPPNAVPKRYEDLLSPKWKKQEIAMEYNEQTWFAAMLDIVGEQEGLQFMKRLAAQDLYLREGKSLLTQLLAAGEFAILINNYVDVATKVKDSGAAIDWLPARNPIPASTHLVGIHARSLHPNAARLFVDFLLSKNGQMLLAGNLGKFPAHPAVESNLRRKVGGFKLYPLNPSMMSGFDRVSKLYETIFLKQR